jgi:hypothetical protein
MTPRADQRHTDWRAELAAARAQLTPPPPRAAGLDRCSCGHLRAGHAGRYPSARTPAGRPTGQVEAWPDACSVMACGCEIFRGEADR